MILLAVRFLYIITSPDHIAFRFVHLCIIPASRLKAVFLCTSIKIFF